MFRISYYGIYMKKYVVGIIVAIGIVGLVVLSRFKPKSSTPSSSSNNSTAPGPASTASTTTSTTTDAGSTAPTYKDGSYTGTAIDNGYGIVQVEAIVSAGKLTDVKFLQMPSGGHSSQVAAMAEPALLNEALTAQTANVNIVSGATQDSQAFQQSLQAALKQAS